MIRILPYDEISSTIEETCRLFFEESKLPGVFDFWYWLNRWGVMYLNDMGNIFSYEVSGVNVGILGGLYVDCMMTGDKEAIEAFWFVRKEHRGSIGGVRLIKAFEEEAKRRGCARIKMAYLSSLNPEQMDALYRKLDYQPLQVNFVKEISYERPS